MLFLICNLTMYPKYIPYHLFQRGNKKQVEIKKIIRIKAHDKDFNHTIIFQSHTKCICIKCTPRSTQANIIVYVAQ